MSEIMSNDQEVINIIGEKLSSSNITIKNVLLNVVIPQEVLTFSNIIFTIVECQGSYALFIFDSEKKVPTKFSDLTIEHIIPIDEYFYCDNQSIPSSYTHERFSITCKTLRLTFHIEIGPDGDIFKEEITRAKEAFLLNALDHKWLERFRHDSGTSDAELGDEANLPASRQRGARGHSSASRESMFRFEMESRKTQFTKTTERSIFVGTWNVNGQLPPPPDVLKCWLAIDRDPPMLYAIGFQELDLSKEAFLFNDSPREAEWEKAVMASTHADAKYRRLALIRLVGIQLIVLVHSDHYSHVKDVDTSTVGTGLLGKMGNKGGVAVRIRLYDTTLCFVCSHLAAHQDEVERRNQDYRDIVDRIYFRKPPQTIKEHDQLYWLGDLNYRIMKFHTEEIKRLLSTELDILLKYDQLMMEQQKGKCFEGFLEAPIKFNPTYKYDLNCDKYDTSEKGRAPAWTDRVLYRGKGIHPIEYRCHMELKISDHKPVSCVFQSEIAVVDDTKLKRVQEEVFKLMDKLENEILPQVTVDRTELYFDLVKFHEPVHQEVIVANTGQVPVTFSFANKVKEDRYCKDWLRITPNRGSIEPGDKCDIRFEITLLDPASFIEDILVLHLENGKDIFISVSAQCQRSCFTTSISVLCRCPVPILNMSDEQLQLAVKEQSPVRYSIPRELWLLTDHLYRHGLRVRMFDSTGLHDDIIKIRDWLDKGSLNPIPVENITAAAECLLLFLSHTKDPVIPYHLTESAILSANNFQQCKEFIKRLPDLHRNVYLYIIMFLTEVLKYSVENGTDSKMLATIFGDILLRSPKGKIERQQAQKGKVTFVHQFLVNDISSLIMPITIK